jgi:riboflavin kinase/FMN adenylyltransferase
MMTLHSLNDLHDTRLPVLLAAGFFDGVHRGHQQVIRRALATARRGSAQTWVMTFDPHPQKVLAPASAPSLLTSTPHKLRLLEALGVTGCVVVPFTPATARQEPEAFIAALKRAVPTLAHIYIGRNWNFGRNGRGNSELLQRIAADLGFHVSAIPQVCWRGKPVSSTRIRQAIASGRLADAARMLGRPFSVLGKVLHGRRIGRTLGFPTANLDSRNEILPPQGIYAVTAAISPGAPLRRQADKPAGRTSHERLAGIANLGTRPTFAHPGPKRTLLELHLFATRRNLYGKTIEVYFHKRLRTERKFATPDALRAQIKRDIAQAHKLAALRPRPPRTRKNIFHDPPFTTAGETPIITHKKRIKGTSITSGNAYGNKNQSCD